MNNDELTAIVVRLEMLRGACNVPNIKKADIARSIEKFIAELNAGKFTGS